MIRTLIAVIRAKCLISERQRPLLSKGYVCSESFDTTARNVEFLQSQATVHIHLSQLINTERGSVFQLLALHARHYFLM